mmetsp:Transcript_20018/g.70799  ORF Transcript_20018/g.70799 Transcript_20018/m.70799 type:complete len:145 (+) Transcript_20018:377-811(+)
MQGIDVFTGRMYEGMQKAKHSVRLTCTLVCSIASASRPQSLTQPFHRSPPLLLAPQVECPEVTRDEFEIMDVDEEDGFVSMMREDGTTRADLRIPMDDDKSAAAGELGFNANQLKEIIEEGEMVVTAIVIGALGIEQVVSLRAA